MNIQDGQREVLIPKKNFDNIKDEEASPFPYIPKKAQRFLDAKKNKVENA